MIAEGCQRQVVWLHSIPIYLFSFFSNLVVVVVVVVVVAFFQSCLVDFFSIGCSCCCSCDCSLVLFSFFFFSATSSFTLVSSTRHCSVFSFCQKKDFFAFGFAFFTGSFTRPILEKEFFLERER